MKILVAILAISLAGASASPSCETYDLVKSFMGSGGWGFGYGSLNPAAQVPFGALRLGPDTTTSTVDITFQHFSGYNYFDTVIRGFSHTHLVGAGVPDLGNFGLMPLSADRLEAVRSSSSTESPRQAPWWVSFNKDTESASPGIYSVTLGEHQASSIDVDLLATGTHSAVHRYTFSDDNPSSVGLLVDVCHSAKHYYGDGGDPKCVEASLRIHPDGLSFDGYALLHGGLTRGNVPAYIAGSIAGGGGLSADWRVCTGWGVCSTVTGSTTNSTTGTLHATGALQGSLGSLEVTVGISFIDEAHAWENLRASLSGGDGSFAGLMERTKEEWCERLARVEVKACDGDDKAEALVATALYHTQMSPTIYTETSGEYRGMDGEVHDGSVGLGLGFGATSSSEYGFSFANYSSARYSDLSLWDTHRSQNPWLLFFDEDVAVGLLHSFVGMTNEMDGIFPHWPIANNEASCMVGSHGAALFLEALESSDRLNGLFDITTVQQALQRMATTAVSQNGRSDLDFYLSHGYVSLDADHHSATNTLTYAFDDFLLYRLSLLTDSQSDADAAQARSTNYANVWSSERRLFCPKYANGTFACPLKPAGYLSSKYYQEGDAMHYKYFVPHDPQGLIDLFPSPHAFDEELNQLFTKHLAPFEEFGSFIPDPYYWAGNEHDLLDAWLFNYGPNCSRTQYWTRRLTELHYSVEAGGIPGNDDYAAMSSWLLFASIGLYPQAGTPYMLLGSPRVDSINITINRYASDTDARLAIIAHDNSPTARFVSRVTLNGEDLTSPIVHRNVFMDNDDVLLEFFMSEDASDTYCA